MTTTPSSPRSAWHTMLDRALLARQSSATSQARGELASLRGAANGNPDAVSKVLPLVFAVVPESMSGGDGLSRAERAALHALCAHAVHVQGSSTARHRPGAGVGEAIARTGMVRDSAEAVNRRFRALLSASGMEEAVQHLRPLLRMARDAGADVDFAQLAVDLFQFEDAARRDRVRIRWARAFEHHVHTSTHTPDTKENTNDLR